MVSTPRNPCNYMELLLIYRTRRDGRLSWPSWLTHSGRIIHELVTRQPWIRRRSGKVRQLQTDVLTTDPRRQPICKVGDVAQWLGRRSVAGGLSLWLTGDHFVGKLSALSVTQKRRCSCDMRLVALHKCLCHRLCHVQPQRRYASQKGPAFTLSRSPSLCLRTLACGDTVIRSHIVCSLMVATPPNILLLTVK